MDRSNYSRAELVERVDFSPHLLMAKFRMADPFAFEPGQYATIAIEDGNRLIQRPYSIVSSPRETLLEFYIELVPGGALTPRLWELKVGDAVLIRKRMVGKLTLCEQFGNLHHVMLATVTGAAPFISMLRTHAFDLAKGTAPARRFALFHGASRSADLGIYTDELTTLARDGWLDYVPTVSRPWEDPAWTGETGRVEDVLRKEVARLGLTAANTMGYLCGHPGMIENARSMLRRVRFPEERIREERFFVKPADTDEELTATHEV